jgi:serine/threonine-protein kinase HipA
MGRKKHTLELLCLMNDQLVGVLSKKHAQLSFQYKSEWLTSKVARPISLCMPMQERPHTGDKTHAYFENLLPDNNQVRQKLVDQLGAASTHPFDLLRVIGADCIGALTFVDEAHPIQSDRADCQGLSEAEVARILRNTAGRQTLGMEPNEDFRISLAGAQEKTALTYRDNQWCKPIGSMPTTHILKLPMSTNDQFGPNLNNSVENEYFCMRLMSNLGFNVAHTEIVTFEDIKVLSVERFDRKYVNRRLVRLPQEDLCQALGVVSGSKYEEHGGPGILKIMGLLSHSISPLEDRGEFMRAQIIFWLIAAIDGHAKNYSIFLRPNGFQLTPFYDILSAIPYFGQGNITPKKIKMAMALSGKNRHYHWNEIFPRHFIATAKKAGFDEIKIRELIAKISRIFPKALNQTIAELPENFPIKIIETIEKYARKKLTRLKAV